MPIQSIEPGDSRATVRARIEAIITLGLGAGQASSLGNWGTARARLNTIADNVDLPAIAALDRGSVSRTKINAIKDSLLGSDWMDFEAGTSKLANYSGLTDTWSGGLVQTPTGYANIAANALARSALGLQTVPTRTNKSTNRNANPVDLAGVTKAGDAASVLSVVDDVAALAAAGLSGICTGGKVYKLDNSLGTGVVVATFTGLAGNTNIHTISVVARTTGAAGSAVRFAQAVNVSATIGAAEYQRYAATGTPSSATDQAQIRAPAGAVVYFILNQLEEGSFATPPIVTTGSAVTRTGNRQVIDLTGRLQYGVAGFVKVDLREGNASSFARIMEFNDGTNLNRAWLVRTGGKIGFEVYSGNTYQGWCDLGGWTE